jgi:hypothetical protein
MMVNDGYSSLTSAREFHLFAGFTTLPGVFCERTIQPMAPIMRGKSKKSARFWGQYDSLRTIVDTDTGLEGYRWRLMTIS